MVVTCARRSRAQEVRLTVAGVELALHPLDAGGPELLAGRFGALDPRTRAHPVDARIELATVARLLHPECGDGDELRVEPARGENVRLWRQDLDVEWNPGEARFAASVFADPWSLASVLRVACALVLPRCGGRLLHASSVVGKHGAFLFPGASGAGKTTLARLADHRAVLSDEISAVRWAGDAFVCFPRPFWGELGERRPSQPAPLRGIGLPARSARAAIHAVSRAHVLARLLSCALAFVERPSEMLRVLDVAARLVERVPAYEVRFAPDASPWSLIDALDPLPTSH